MDFSAHACAPEDVKRQPPPLPASACRPRLSLAPESFAPSAVRLGARLRRTLSRLSWHARSLGLRDSGGGCSFGVRHSPKAKAELSRAAIRKRTSGDARALA